MVFRDLFTTLTASESAFIEGSKGDALGHALHTLEAGQSSEGLLTSIRDSVAELSETTADIKVFTGFDDNIRTEAGILTPDSMSQQFHVRVIPDARYAAHRHSFNVMSSNVVQRSFARTERPLPVRIGKKHVQERFDERSEFEGVFQNEDMFHTLAIATAMVKIFEQKANGKKVPETPIAIPGKNGLFLGIIVPTKEEQHHNRFYLSASLPDIDRTPAFYKSIPKATAEIRTFIGMENLKPNQRRLLETMHKYIDERTTESLTHGIFSYQDTIGYSTPQAKQALPYKQAEESLRRIIGGKPWRSAVHPPNMLHLRNGVIAPRR